MAKYVTVFTAISIAMLLLCGCQEETAKPVKSEEKQPLITQPAEPEAAITQVPEIVTPTEPKKTKTLPDYYDKYAVLLKKYVNDNGMVDYAKLRRKRPEIKNLLDHLAKLDPKTYQSWSKEDKIALWINAYNIQMLNVITKNYPIESSRFMRVLWPPTSIRHVDRNIGGIKKQKFIVMDEEFTLEEIEKRFLRDQFDEPRALLAITHASLSSPIPRNKPYSGNELDKQLDEQVRNFLSSEKGFRIQRNKSVVALSAIFQASWHGKYFVSKYNTNKKFKNYETNQRAVLNFVSKYVSRRNANYLELENYEVAFIKYDWRLNDSSEK
ncbi:MAG: DUF547 domain-containing protein [Planctomycetes bacterium]|nr:DUF547 domain-containing protein [Planctomycetota bacterium]